MYGLGTFVFLQKSKVGDHCPHSHCRCHLLSAVLESVVELAEETEQ